MSRTQIDEDAMHVPPPMTTARALEVVLSRCKMDRQTADVLRRLLGLERAAALRARAEGER